MIMQGYFLFHEVQKTPNKNKTITGAIVSNPTCYLVTQAILQSALGMCTYSSLQITSSHNLAHLFCLGSMLRYPMK